MNKDTKQIMKILSVDVETAQEIQQRMADNGFNFSEATDRQFKKVAVTAQQELEQQ